MTMKLTKAVILTCPLLIIVCLYSGLSANTNNHHEAIVTQAQVQPQEKTQYVSLGTFTITAYCPCEKCCGSWSKNRPVDAYGNTIVYTASGAEAIQGVTIAADSDIPYGTTLYIDGHRYIVQDRGGVITDKRLDIYFNRHQDALNYGVQIKEVWGEMARGSD